MASAVMKLEAEQESCCVCGSDGGGELMTPEEHDTAAGPMQVPLRAMLLHLNNNKVLPDGRLCLNCVRRTIDAYEFSSNLSNKGVPPLSEKIRALRRRLHELTQKIDVFIVVGGPGMNAGGSYSEEDIIMVDKDALAAATAADEEDSEKSKNARGETVYQCTVCPLSFQRVSEYREHASSHPATALHSCWSCGAQFSSRAAAREHARLHEADRALMCYLCQATFQSPWEHRRHCAGCAGGGACPLCGARVFSRPALAAHAAAAHGRGAAPPLLCAVCFKAFEAEEDYSAHALAHRRADHFVCGYDGCILRFGTRTNLLSHIRAAHASAPPPPAPRCAQCGRTFGSAAALKRHARAHARAEADDGAEYLEMDALDD
ncbi:zinc finger protein 771 [Amyelois transitella]|uniref:zinc finger protein 771 n=1 Tax=Amyelois transitella TaxID=680683 RepID=UPI002990627E|nr:zinc finger protein 771 [Amyelois transitella]